MKVLGISCCSHDSAACLVRGGRVVSAAQEERFLDTAMHALALGNSLAVKGESQAPQAAGALTGERSP